LDRRAACYGAYWSPKAATAFPGIWGADSLMVSSFDARLDHSRGELHDRSRAFDAIRLQ
jgi:hypothetical protein